MAEPGVGDGAGAEGHGRAVGGGLEEVSGQGVARGEADRVQRPVNPAPARPDVLGEPVQVWAAGEVHVNHLDGLGQPGRGGDGEAPVAGERGQEDVRAGPLGVGGDGPRDAVGADDAGDDQALVGKHGDLQVRAAGERAASGEVLGSADPGVGDEQDPRGGVEQWAQTGEESVGAVVGDTVMISSRVACWLNSNRPW